MSLIEVEHLKKYYPVKSGLFGRTRRYIRAVDDVSFHIHGGETLGLVGESGCGKTTLGRCLIRLIEPDSGTIRFSERNLLQIPQSQMRPLRRHMQMIFQDPYGSLNPRMSIGSIVEEPLIIHRTAKKAQRKERVSALLEMVGLDASQASRYPHEFSGGQRQRVGIARALALDPQWIIADEPVSSLDVSIQAQIINLLQDLQQKLHLTYLFIAHDLSVVQHISDRIGVMYLGKIVEIASSIDLFRHPMHPYTFSLIASVPVPNPDHREKRSDLKGEVASAIKVPSGCRFHPRCPIASERCKSEEPALREMKPGHSVACHFPL